MNFSPIRYTLYIMIRTSRMSFTIVFLIIIISLCHNIPFVAPNFNSDFTVIWGQDHVNISDGGEDMQLSMDQNSGSGSQSNNEFLFGKFDVQVKINPPDSTGTITTFYLQSQDEYHDEVDFEFLGSTSTDKYALHTNLYTNGIGSREQQFHFQSNPSSDFHTYSIFWNPHQIMWYFDGIPIRVFKKSNDLRLSYPDLKPMKVHASLWDGSKWTGNVNWTNAPFRAEYRTYHVNACVVQRNGSSCDDVSPSPHWLSHVISDVEKNKIAYMKANYMYYDYCNDTQNGSEATRVECALNSN